MSVESKLAMAKVRIQTLEKKLELATKANFLASVHLASIDRIDGPCGEWCKYPTDDQGACTRPEAEYNKCWSEHFMFEAKEHNGN